MSVFDFREQQARTRRQSALLVAAFVVIVAGISLALGLLAGFLMRADAAGMPADMLVDWRALDPALVAGGAGLAMAAILGAALIRIAILGRDGARVAHALGAEEVTHDTANPFKRRYLNVVEEMAIAAGLPAPRAFVMKHESGINAFAAGHDPAHAAIGITHGALAMLDRAELAGVVAHEMAHIANRDTRLNTRLMGMVFGLVMLYTAGRVVIRNVVFIPRRRDNRAVLPAVALGAGLIVLGLAGVLAGRLLQSAISRRREYLADATGVQFTRDPAGLAGALKKIGAATRGAHIDNAHVEEARHMFFASANASFGGPLGTHPPLTARIRALDPGFDPATDPVWNADQRAIMRGTRRELGLGPWGQHPEGAV